MDHVKSLTSYMFMARRTLDKIFLFYQTDMFHTSVGGPLLPVICRTRTTVPCPQGAQHGEELIRLFFQKSDTALPDKFILRKKQEDLKKCRCFACLLVYL
ncbi:hypothetical protein ATANTOWER_004052 [Ataeniobius toweri]|uniref:Uncharacterized protein n=1 Tax=Ataeniobius toweri TaxID=208326 RepID=A0ABU7AF71_9TELE|nr:hypothetical protein [Ataeniobius toweri]